jgi:sugar-specific transcriptional regulator TrmB
MEPIEYVDKMMRLGIPDAQARIYIALLCKREMSAIEIQEITDVPRTKVYEITQQMVLRGLCIEKRIGRTKKFQAVEPQRALETLMHEQERELQSKKNLIQEINEYLMPLYTQGMQKKEFSDNIEILKDMKAIHERYINLVKSTHTTMLAFAKPPSAHMNMTYRIRQQMNALFGILKQGVEVRMLFELADKRYMDAEAIRIQQLIKSGCHARILEQIPIKAYVFDNTYVLMALENPPTETQPLTMIVVTHKSLASAFGFLFNYLWAEAKDTQIYDLLRRSKYITNA